MNRIIDGGTHIVRAAAPGLAPLGARDARDFAVGLWGTYTMYRAVPSSFVPSEDEGYFIAIIQAPSGASLDYTTGLAQQAEKIVMADPQVLAVFSVAGFSFSGAAPNQGLMFARLRPYEERREPSQSLTAVIGRLQGQLFGGITGGLVIPVAPPSLQGVSQFGGFQMEIVDNSGGPIERLAQVTGDVIGRGNQSGRVAGLFSSFTADDPQLVVDIDRDRARGLNLPMSAVTDTLQVLLGSQYVNDFDFNNRAYRVYVQADQAFRSRPDNLRQFYARTTTGNMVPLDTVVRLRETTAPSVISHFNLQRSAEITGSPMPGVSSGQAIQLMEQIASEALPPGFDHAWAGLSLEEIRAGSQAVLIFALSVIVVYLILAAQYESWILPVIILLGVPLAVFGALSAQLLRGLPERRLLPDRSGHARRSRGEELDPDRRVRGTFAAAGIVDCRCGGRGRAHPAAADSDDVARVHPRRAAAGHRHGRRFRRAPVGRDDRHGRDDHVHVPVDRLHSGAVRRHPHALPRGARSRSHYEDETSETGAAHA